MTSPKERHPWHEAAAGAAFTFFRPSEPPPDAIGAGGYGYGSRPGLSTTSLAIHARVAGREVSVETAQNQHRHESRLLVMEALDAYLLGRRDPIELPWTAEVVAETRTIAVDGVAKDFDGVRVVGGTRWAGFAQVGDVTVRVTTEDPAVVTAIERCTDFDLPDFVSGI